MVDFWTGLQNESIHILHVKNSHILHGLLELQVNVIKFRIVRKYKITSSKLSHSVKYLSIKYFEHEVYKYYIIFQWRGGRGARGATATPPPPSVFQGAPNRRRGAKMTKQKIIFIS